MDSMTCPKCGEPVGKDAVGGLCPACLMRAGLNRGRESKHQTHSYPSPGSHFNAPAPQALARHFPQLAVERLLGQGGMGAVYLARQKSLDRPVALKIIRPESAGNPGFAERFAREARSLARLSHPNIVGVHDFGSVPPELKTSDASERSRDPDKTSPLYFLIMEYVDGANLRDLIIGRQLSSREALAIVPQICDALQFAHDAGVVHRDIKPENILVDRQGRVKIADFGLAKLMADASDERYLTGTHQVMGTPSYMAPEQLEQSRSIDHRADIYSLGVVFYEMLTGELPIGVFEPPSKKVQIDVRLDDVVLRALAKEPARRYQKASQVKTDVESVESIDRKAAEGTPGGPPNKGALEKSPARRPEAAAGENPRSLFNVLWSTTSWAMFFCALAAISPALTWSFGYSFNIQVTPTIIFDTLETGLPPQTNAGYSAYTDWHGAAISIAGGIGLLFLIATSALRPIPWWRTLGMTIIGAVIITVIVIFAEAHWNHFPVRESGGLLAIVSVTGLLFIACLELRGLIGRTVASNRT